MCVGMMSRNPGYSHLPPSVLQDRLQFHHSSDQDKAVTMCIKTIHINVCSPWSEKKLLWLEGVEKVSVLQHIILTIIIDLFVKCPDVTRMLRLDNPQRTWT